VTDLQDRAATAAHGYVFRDTGLHVTRELTRTEWTEAGAAIRSRTEGGHWALGDWLVYGGRTGRNWLGSSYAHAIRVTGYGLPWLSTAFKVSEAFPPEVRDPQVTWGAYRVLHGVAESLRGDLLRTVRQKRWSAADLQAHLDERHPRTFGAATGRGPARRSQRDRVVCPNCSHVFPIHGNREKKEKKA
jgi:hypothetical protein